MKRTYILTLLLGVLCTLSVLAAEPGKPAAKKTVRLLTIGNSFSQDATVFLDDLAAADGNLLILKTANVGGSPLKLHWDRAELRERDPQDSAGTYSAGRGLKEILSDGPHDFVTIQQRSLSSHDVATYRPYAAKLQEYVKKYAPDAELLLHETWAYRVDDPRFGVATPKAGEPNSQREMYDGLAQAYRTIATELKVRLIPVGDAFLAADTDAKWGFKRDDKFNPKTAASPDLPDQKRSLHIGFSWKKNDVGGMTLGMDGHHASAAGRYLGACVWYEVLFETSCVGNKFLPGGIDAEYGRFLQETAHAAVAKNKAK